MDPHHRCTSAARHPPLRPNHQQFLTQLDLSLACFSAARFQLDKGHLSAGAGEMYHHHIGQSAPHTAQLPEHAAHH
jgi:hypothetical protein